MLLAFKTDYKADRGHRKHGQKVQENVRTPFRAQLNQPIPAHANQPESVGY